MVDVAIVGGGVCGCSLLYALSRYKLRCVLLEKSNDVGVAATKANSAIVHAGYDPEPGTLMAKYNVEGNALVRQLAARLDILYRPVGSLVVGFSEADRAAIRRLYGNGQKNGVPKLEILNAHEACALEPGLSERALCALHAPTAAIVNPWELAFAQAEVAVKNGAGVRLDTELTGLQKLPGGGFELATTAGALSARFVVNCAGVHSAQVAQMAGAAGFSICPSRGQYYLLDKSEGGTVCRVVFQCPTPDGKGVLVAPTVHGNLIVGPNAEPAASNATTRQGLDDVRRQALKAVPALNFKASIRNFAGLRAAADTGDFIIGPHPGAPGFFNVAGIKSPGLTAAPAIALDVVRQLAAAGLELREKPDYDDGRRVLRFSRLGDEERAAAIAENPRYARIVCRCETVSEGEILDMLRRPLPPRSLDAVKRRAGPGMGRCQGGFCGPRVQAMIARQLGLPQEEIPQDRAGMTIVMGRTKQARAAAEAPRKGGSAE